MRAIVRDGRLEFFCPGCQTHHGPVIDGTLGWTWNGNVDRPTVQPSILVTWPKWDGEHRLPDRVCHSFVTDGRIQFLADSTHALAGQTVDLPEVEP